MPTFVIPFPVIDPVLVQVGPFAIRWYALAYIAGLIGGWLYARRLATDAALWGGRPRPTNEDLDDLLVYAALGVVLGGRVGYVLFYNFEWFLQNPFEMFAVWKGGMSFHGGLIGCGLAMALLAWRRNLPLASLADVACAVVPIGLGLGRVANFINTELWGRVTDVPWAMVFPGAGPLPRHPSQLYEATLEGLVLFLLLALAIRAGALRRPWMVAGLFGIGYGLARIICEFFREPDAQLGFLVGGATMGMLLSLPLVAAASPSCCARAASRRPRPPRRTGRGDDAARARDRAAHRGGRADHRRPLHGAVPRRSAARLLHDARPFRRGRRFRHRAGGVADVRRVDRPVVRRHVAAPGRACPLPPRRTRPRSRHADGRCTARRAARAGVPGGPRASILSRRARCYASASRPRSQP